MSTDSTTRLLAAVDDVRSHVTAWTALLVQHVHSLPHDEQPTPENDSPDCARSYAEHELAAMRRDLAALLAAADASQCEIQQAARDKTLDAMYQFSEVGPGFWKLRDILIAFEEAYEQVGGDALYREPKIESRVRLANKRLVSAVRGYGLNVITGNGKNAYTIYFARELIEAVGGILRNQAVRQIEGVPFLLEDCQLLHPKAD